MPDAAWGVENADENATLWIWSRTKHLPEVVRIETEPPQRVIEGYRVQEVRVVRVIDGPVICGPYERREVPPTTRATGKRPA